MASRTQSGNKKSQTGRLRIVAGKWRSRLLDIADVPGLRPTSARIRETLFNWLAMDVAGAKCLDLCAGTGALGIEALSRGAASVVFIEKSPVAVRVLASNLRQLGADNASIEQRDATVYLGAGATTAYDIVFLDPPFAADLAGELCRLLLQGGWLAPHAKVYLEMGRQQPAPQLAATFCISKDKTAGNVRYMLATLEGGNA